SIRGCKSMSYNPMRFARPSYPIAGGAASAASLCYKDVKMTLYDITRTISPTLKVWPGDAQYSAHPVLKMDEGAAVNLTTLTLSSHTGTHADAYFHYTKSGAHP